MNVNDLKQIMSVDAALASAGLRIEDFAGQNGMLAKKVDRILQIIPKLGLRICKQTIGGEERLFYDRKSGPLFRCSPIPERRGRPRKIDHELALQMRREGKTRSEVAAALGCTPDAVRKVEVSAGLVK